MCLEKRLDEKCFFNFHLINPIQFWSKINPNFYLLFAYLSRNTFTKIKAYFNAKMKRYFLAK